MTSGLNISATVSGDLLNIQKLVVLLNEDAYGAFLSHLQQTRAHLPAKLIGIIRQAGFHFQTTDELCELVYQKSAAETRNNFYQLSTYTFRLSEYVAINFPGYLLHNLQLIEALIAKQRLAEAQFLSQILLDIAEKICDFTTQMHVLRYLANQEQIFKQPQKAQQYYEQVKAVAENCRTLDEIYYLLRNDFSRVNLAVKKSPDEIYPVLDALKKHHASPVRSISMLSRYASLSIRHYFLIDLGRLYEELSDFEKELQNHSYILMPYLFDIRTSCSFIWLGRSGFDINGREGMAFISTYKKHYDAIAYWGSYLNMPRLYILMMKAQNYIERYGNLLHRRDYPDLLPEKDKADIIETSDECLAMIDRYEGTAAYTIDIINLRMITGGLLMLQAGPHIREGIGQVEQSINHYQQVKKSRSIGNSYLILIMGYFVVGEYRHCLDTYARYQKISKKRDMYEQVDIKIQIYYNFARWLLEKDPACIPAIADIYAHCRQDTAQQFNRQLIDQMASYFEVPLAIT